MHRPAAAALALAFLASGCTCGTSAPNKVFVCATGDDCADGFVCDQTSKTCVSKGAGGGVGGSGGTGAPTDADHHRGRSFVALVLPSRRGAIST